MAKQIINIGNSPNDGTGDTLRAGGKKINENFTEVYSLLNNKVEFITIFSNGATSDFDLIKDYINTNGLQVAKDTILKFIITKLKTSSSGSSGSIFGAVEEKFYQWKPGAGNFGTPFGDTITTARWQLVSVVTYLSTSSHDLGEIGTTNIEDAVNSSGPYDIPPNIFTTERNGEQNVYMYIGNAIEIGLGATQTAADDFVDLTDEDPAPPDLTDYVTYGVFNGSLYDTAETGFSTDLSNFTSLTEKFYFLRISGEGDTVYFASKDDNVEDFVGSRIYISATGTKHDLGAPDVTQNGYNFWDIGVLPVTINPSTEEWDFQAWINREKFDLQKVTDKGNVTTNDVVINSSGNGKGYILKDQNGRTVASLDEQIDGTGNLWLREYDGAGNPGKFIRINASAILFFENGSQTASFKFPENKNIGETFAMLSDLTGFADDDDVLHDTGEPDKVAMKDDSGKDVLDFQSDWNEGDTNSVKHIANKPEETNFSVYNQYSEVIINTTTATELITADTGVLNIANLNEGASYIGSLTGLFASGAVDGQTLTFRIGIGNRSVLTQAINTGTQTGDLPVKVDYTINFVSNQIARITMFIQVGTASTATVQENSTVINIGNEFDFTLQLSGETFTTYSSYLHRHVQ